MSQLLRITMSIVATSIVVGPSTIRAAQVRGSVTPPPQNAPRAVEGYARSRVAAPAPGTGDEKKAVALFLRSKESLPIPAPEQHLEITIEGLQFVPAVATCAVDAEVVFTNKDPEPIEVMVGSEKIGPIGPNVSVAYKCSVGDSEEPRQVRTRWRHMLALIQVGVSGVAARPNDRGYFLMNAPQGTYELQYVTSDGIVKRTPVEIGRADIDVGSADLAVSSDADTPTGDGDENE